MSHDDPYYHSHDLARFPDIGKNRPELAQKFFDWYGAVFAEGALTAREKSLIALAVAHAVQCPYCIDAYSKDGKTYASPVDAGMVGFWYNKELFAKAGVTPPKTWPQFLAVIQKLKAANITPQ